jgi:hypothetical protein
MTRILAALALATLVAACSESTGPECRVGADCASGACSREGMCLPPNPLDAGDTTPDASDVDGGAPEVDGGFDDAGNPIIVDASTPDAGTVETDAGGCQRNDDGLLERSEVVMGAGLRASYRIAQSASVNTAGVDLGGGKRRWDFSTMLDGDHRVEVTTDAPESRWYSSDFPAATYVSKLSDSSALLGVFQVTDNSLLLLGVVSPTDASSTYTNLEYDPPIEVLQFPLQLGKTWSTSSWVTGYYNGLFLGLGYAEDYEYEVTAEGELLIPYSDMPFPVMRVSVELTKTVGFLVTTLHTQSYLSECFGPIASVSSEENETNAEFTTAAELRRLAP